MRRRVMHDAQGKLTYQDYGKQGQAIYSVSRGLLNQRLLDLQRNCPTCACPSDSGSSVDQESAQVVIEENGRQRTIEADWLFGADGAFSQVRSSMMSNHRFSYEQQFIDHGYKEAFLQQRMGFQLEKEALHIWPRANACSSHCPTRTAHSPAPYFFLHEGLEPLRAWIAWRKHEHFSRKYFPMHWR